MLLNYFIYTCIIAFLKKFEVKNIKATPCPNLVAFEIFEILWNFWQMRELINIFRIFWDHHSKSIKRIKYHNKFILNNFISSVWLFTLHFKNLNKKNFIFSKETPCILLHFCILHEILGLVRITFLYI